jgi:replication-associated recombination protein RarA
VIATRVLYDNWLEAKKAKNDDALPLFLAHAVCVLARAAKSGIALHAVMAFWMGDRQAMRLEIPDHALDKHTVRGRRLGRGFEHFFEEGAKLANVGLDDPYEIEARAAVKKRPAQPEQVGLD